MNSDKFNYRYYKGEPECPFSKKHDYSAHVFWHEEMYHSKLEPARKQQFVDILTDMIREGAVSGPLADNSLPLADRSVACFAELHLSKFNPLSADIVDWKSYFLRV